ncbi:MAG: GntR family transcriptional regulator [Rhodospirillaceae bacterium]|nr:GntR family transcriptional regulator [Rhodospirillaceae bacterium]
MVLLGEELGVVPIARETVQDRIYRQLRDLLMRGRFQPGQPMMMQELAEAFGTSTQPVREAIRQLVAEKALEALPNRTARVPVIARAQLDDFRRARVAIEGLAAELAAQRASAEDVQSLGRLVSAEARADDDNRPDVSVEQNQAFHFALYKLSGSKVLPPIIEGLWLQIGPYIRRSAEEFDARDGRGAEFHTAALEALRKRDVAGVRAAIEGDINRFFDLCHDLNLGRAHAGAA